MQIFNSNLPEDKSIFFSLTHVHGMHKKTAFIVAKKLGFAQNLRFNQIEEPKFFEILLETIQTSKKLLGNKLKKKKELNQQWLIDIKSYKGFWKLQGLPIRGQRTHSNASTAWKRFL